MFGHMLKVKGMCFKEKKRDQDRQICTFPKPMCPHSSLKTHVFGVMFLNLYN